MLKQIFTMLIFVFAYELTLADAVCFSGKDQNEVIKEHNNSDIYVWYQQVDIQKCPSMKLWKFNSQIKIVSYGYGLFLDWNSDNKNDKFDIARIKKEQYVNPVYIVHINTTQKDAIFVSKNEYNIVTNIFCYSENNKKELSVHSGICAEALKQADIFILDKDLKKASKLAPKNYGTFSVILHQR